MTSRFRDISFWQELLRRDRQRWLRELQQPAVTDGNVPGRSVLRSWRKVPDTSQDTGVGPLEGVPFLVKDLYDVSGEVTACSSAVVMEGDPGLFPPARDDAVVIEAFRRRGAVLMGRTQMNEFAYGIDGRNSYTGDCRHPRDERRITGGSSSGSAWAVAAGLVPLALGTDTGGSIRVPAALCGIYGYRRPWSSTDLEGVFPLAASMDTVGWFTGSAGDMLVVLNAMNTRFRGRDDAAAREEPSRDEPSRLEAPSDLPNHAPELISRVPQVEWIIEPGHLPEFPTAFDGDLIAAMGRLRNRVGWDLSLSRVAPSKNREVIQRLLSEGRQAYNIIGSREAWQVHKELLDRYQQRYDPVVWALIDRGRKWTQERYHRAVAFREQVRSQLEGLFLNLDALVLPVTPQATPLDRDVDGPFRETILSLNCLASLAGWPVLTIPVPLDDVRSGGVQVIAPPGREWVFYRILEKLREAEWPST